MMRGAARYCWSHGITPRHYDTLPGRELGLQLDGLTLIDRDVRVSLTFRSVGVERLYLFKFCYLKENIPWKVQL